MDCFVCKASNAHQSRREDHIEVGCPRCGDYKITDKLAETMQAEGPRYRLSGVLRLRSAQRRSLFLSPESADAAEGMAPKDMEGRLLALLHFIHLNTSRLGEWFKMVQDEHFTVAFARHPNEFGSFLGELRDRGWITIGGSEGVSLTLKGWAATEVVEKETSQKVFVAMSFNTSRRPIYDEAIRPAIERAGYSPIRVDDLHYNGTIDDRIIAEIKESLFIVADFTDHKAGVYFEAGFALGLGIPVIFTCTRSEIGQLHFDTKMYNALDWESYAELEERLFQRIRATIGYGPNARRSGGETQAS